MKHAAQFELSEEMLHRFLTLVGMPKETEIAGVRVDGWPPVLRIAVVHPDLPPVAEGGQYPEIEPSVKEEIDDGMHTVYSWDWNAFRVVQE